LGGNRSDVAIVASRGGMYSVLATAHDYMLGGAQLDQVLIDHFAKEFMKKHKTDPRSNPKSLAKLKLESEAVKKALSQSASATFSVESLADGIDFRATVNRTRYELLAAKIFTNFRRLIEDAIRKAGLEVLDIDEVSGHIEQRTCQESDESYRSYFQVAPLTPQKLLITSNRYSPRPLQFLLPRHRQPRSIPPSSQSEALRCRHLWSKNSTRKILISPHTQW